MNFLLEVLMHTYYIELSCFRHYVLGQSSGIEETGGVRWSLALCLVLAWIIVFLCLSKGVQSSGKVRTNLFINTICATIL